MTDMTHVTSARSLLDDLMARVGVDGLVATMTEPALLAVVDQHAAAVREALRAAGRPVDAVSLAGYARSMLSVLDRMGRELPDPAEVDWCRADAVVLRLVAVCALADAADCL